MRLWNLFLVRFYNKYCFDYGKEVEIDYWVCLYKMKWLFLSETLTLLRLTASLWLYSEISFSFTKRTSQSSWEIIINLSELKLFVTDLIRISNLLWIRTQCSEISESDSLLLNDLAESWVIEWKFLLFLCAVVGHEAWPNWRSPVPMSLCWVQAVLLKLLIWVWRKTSTSNLYTAAF